MPSLSAMILPIALAAVAVAPQINPVPRPFVGQAVAEWSFERDTQGWRALHHCTLQVEGGLLRIEAAGDDPYFHRPVDFPGGAMLLQVKARSWNSGAGRVYWTTDQSPRPGEDKAQGFDLQHGGPWHEYAVAFHAAGRLTGLRIDPGTSPGKFEIDWIRLMRHVPCPLLIERVDLVDGKVRFSVKNDQAGPCGKGDSHLLCAAPEGPCRQKVTVTFSAGRERLRRDFPPGVPVPLEFPILKRRASEAVTLELACPGFAPSRRTIFLLHPEVQREWISCPIEGGLLKVAADGSLACVYRGDELLAALAPLVLCDGRVPTLKLTQPGPSPRFEGDGVSLALSTAGKEITIAIRGHRPCEGPVVRVQGGLRQGLLAGVEYLGKGEHSSSTLDIETEEHLRFAPDPLKVTMPLMSLVTDRASVAMTWNDTSLGPVFATPNFFDAADDHRMALRGTKIDAVIQVDRLPLEETIFWAVKRRGLPPLPTPPRTGEQQWALCLKAMNGRLKTEAGWGHCAEDHWPRHPFADHASTLFRLTGKAPELPRLVPGGAHVRNDAVYFVTGRARQWQQEHQRQVRSLIAQQRPDGSFRYDGPFRRGHFEDTACGVCARPAMILLEYAWITGDRAAREAGLRTLDYMTRFDTPRGAQVWEIPLHTPDQLASAYCVWAYVRGHQLTGKSEYLHEARRWALSGVPFVYLWSRYPVMLYGTPPVLGATNWRSPNWIGLPVQWVGGVYAYALALLAPYDKSLDWGHLARGILVAAEQMQYPDGPYAGLLPDSFALATQERRPWRINPCALVSLRMALEGQVDSLSVGVEGNRRVAAPFPVTLRNGQAHIQGRRGVNYQVLIDGDRVVDVRSQGDDVLPLP